MKRIVHRFAIWTATCLPLAAAASAVHAQRTPDSTLIALNRALLEQQIVHNSSALFEQTALDQFLVIAPGGVVETKDQAAHGVRSFRAAGISVTNERVSISGTTAIVVGRLEIDGEMQPLGRLAPMRFMAVFVQVGDDWRLLGRSLTPCHQVAVARRLC